MKVEDAKCPVCGKKMLRIEMRLRARPIGSYSLSGRQMKASAVEWPYLVCDGCGIDTPAKDED